MARALLSYEARDQTGAVQPYAFVTVYEANGTTLLAQPLYAGSSGGTAIPNPLTTDSLGRAVAYVDVAQRAVVKTGSGASLVATVVDLADDPADIASAPILLAALAPGSAGLLRSDGAVITAGHTIVNTDIAAGAAIVLTKLESVGAGYMLVGNGSGVVTAALLTDANISASAEIAVSKLADGAAYEAILTSADGVSVAWAASATSVMTVTGDLLYASAANVLAKRAIGATDAVLLVAAGLPTWGTVNTAGITANAITQTFSATGSTAGPTTASGAPADLAEMTSGTFTTAGGKVWVAFNGTFQNTGAGNSVLIDIVLDGSLQIRRTIDAPAANKNFIVSISHIMTMSAAAHTIKIQWAVSAGTATAVGTERGFSGIEVKR